MRWMVCNIQIMRLPCLEFRDQTWYVIWVAGSNVVVVKEYLGLMHICLEMTVAIIVIKEFLKFRQIGFVDITFQS